MKQRADKRRDKEQTSEFIDNALAFYVGYLESNDASNLLGPVLSSMIRGILENNKNLV